MVKKDKIKILRSGGFISGKWKCKPSRKPSGKGDFFCKKGSKQIYVGGMPYGDKVELVGENCKKLNDNQVMCDT